MSGSVSRRGAVRVNPVTGEMVRLTDEELAARKGTHTDGAIRVDDRYINAAKELGLGGAEGMYQHIAALKRVGAADVPVGDSMEREGGSTAGVSTGGRGGGGGGGGAHGAAASGGHRASGAASGGRPAAAGIIDVGKGEATRATLRTSVSTTGRGGKIAGFSSGSGSATSSIHRHADAFQRQRGVVNSLGGVTDTKRHADDDGKLPAKGERAGPRVVSMDTVDTLSKEGRARIEARERREKLERAHSASAGARTGGVHTLSGGKASSSSSKKDGAGFTAVAPTKRPLAPSKVVSGGAPTGLARLTAGTASSKASAATAAPAPSAPASHRLGGVSAGSKENEATSVAAQRAAFFKQKLAEEEARKASARAAAADGSDA